MHNFFKSRGAFFDPSDIDPLSALARRALGKKRYSILSGFKKTGLGKLLKKLFNVPFRSPSSNDDVVNGPNQEDFFPGFIEGPYEIDINEESIIGESETETDKDTTDSDNELPEEIIDISPNVSDVLEKEIENLEDIPEIKEMSKEIEDEIAKEIEKEINKEMEKILDEEMGRIMEEELGKQLGSDIDIGEEVDINENINIDEDIDVEKNIKDTDIEESDVQEKAKKIKKKGKKSKKKEPEEEEVPEIELPKEIIEELQKLEKEFTAEIDPTDAIIDVMPDEIFDEVKRQLSREFNLEEQELPDISEDEIEEAIKDQEISSRSNLTGSLREKIERAKEKIKKSKGKGEGKKKRTSKSKKKTKETSKKRKRKKFVRRKKRSAEWWKKNWWKKKYWKKRRIRRRKKLNRKWVPWKRRKWFKKKKRTRRQFRISKLKENIKKELMGILSEQRKNRAIDPTFVVGELSDKSNSEIKKLIKKIQEKKRELQLKIKDIPEPDPEHPVKISDELVEELELDKPFHERSEEAKKPLWAAKYKYEKGTVVKFRKKKYKLTEEQARALNRRAPAAGAFTVNWKIPGAEDYKGAEEQFKSWKYLSSIGTGLNEYGEDTDLIYVARIKHLGAAKKILWNRGPEAIELWGVSKITGESFRIGYVPATLEVINDKKKTVYGALDKIRETLGVRKNEPLSGLYDVDLPVTLRNVKTVDWFFGESKISAEFIGIHGPQVTSEGTYKNIIPRTEEEREAFVGYWRQKEGWKKRPVATWLHYKKKALNEKVYSFLKKSGIGDALADFGITYYEKDYAKWAGIGAIGTIILGLNILGRKDVSKRQEEEENRIPFQETPIPLNRLAEYSQLQAAYYTHNMRSIGDFRSYHLVRFFTGKAGLVNTYLASNALKSGIKNVRKKNIDLGNTSLPKRPSRKHPVRSRAM